MSAALKLVTGDKGKRCPACKRSDVDPGRRHKTSRRYGSWCDAKPQPERDAALSALGDVHDLLADLYFEGRYAEVMALAVPLLRRAGKR